MPREITKPLCLFAARMSAKLRQNEHKGSWDNCNYDYLLNRLRQETEELAEAIAGGTATDVIDEAADVANFAMMIADVARKRGRK